MNETSELQNNKEKPHTFVPDHESFLLKEPRPKVKKAAKKRVN